MHEEAENQNRLPMTHLQRVKRRKDMAEAVHVDGGDPATVAREYDVGLSTVKYACETYPASYFFPDGDGDGDD